VEEQKNHTRKIKKITKVKGSESHTSTMGGGVSFPSKKGGVKRGRKVQLRTFRRGASGQSRQKSNQGKKEFANGHVARGGEGRGS